MITYTATSPLPACATGSQCATGTSVLQKASVLQEASMSELADLSYGVDMAEFWEYGTRNRVQTSLYDKHEQSKVKK